MVKACVSRRIVRVMSSTTAGRKRISALWPASGSWRVFCRWTRDWSGSYVSCRIRRRIRLRSLENDVLRADVHSFRPTMANAIVHLAEKASGGNDVQKPNVSGGNHPRRNDH